MRSARSCAYERLPDVCRCPECRKTPSSDVCNATLSILRKVFDGKKASLAVRAVGLFHRLPAYIIPHAREPRRDEARGQTALRLPGQSTLYVREQAVIGRDENKLLKCRPACFRKIARIFYPLGRILEGQYAVLQSDSDSSMMSGVSIGSVCGNWRALP